MVSADYAPVGTGKGARGRITNAGRAHPNAQHMHPGALMIEGIGVWVFAGQQGCALTKQRLYKNPKIARPTDYKEARLGGVQG